MPGFEVAKPIAFTGLIIRASHQCFVPLYFPYFVEGEPRACRAPRRPETAA
jgi:hypothetical protein